MYNSCAAFVLCSILSYTLEKFLSICTRTKGCQCHLKASIARCGGGIKGAKVTVKVTRQQRGQLQLPLIDASAARSIELIGRHFKGRKRVPPAVEYVWVKGQVCRQCCMLHATCHDAFVSPIDTSGRKVGTGQTGERGIGLVIPSAKCLH